MKELNNTLYIIQIAMLHDASAEQRAVINHISRGANVIVNAVAGSGKSTTVLSIARALPLAKILQITYNSALRKEFRDKCTDTHNIEVHTYHSLASKYFKKTVNTDLKLRDVMMSGAPPPAAVPAFDIVVLDEVQDCTFLFFRFVAFFARFIPGTFQMLFLGDYMQKIYGFKGADSRFLTQAETLWGGFAKLRSQEFVNCELRTSYRVTNQMARFMNCAMLGTARIKACRDGATVVYIRNARVKIENTIVSYITDLIRRGAKAQDFFILGASVRGLHSHIRKLENALVNRGVPCHVPMSGATEIDERVINSKVVFATFHSCKGRQRKYVFVIGFDHSYYDIFAKDASPDECPNTLYVAASRATERLFLVESSQDRPLPFLHMTHADMLKSAYIDFQGMPRSVFATREPPPERSGRPRNITPSDLSKFVSDSAVERLSDMFDAIFVCEFPEMPDSVIELPGYVCTRNGYYEDVSDLNGVAIPAMFFDRMAGAGADTPVGAGAGAAAQIELIKSYVDEFREGEHILLREAVAALRPQCSTAAEYLYMANLSVAVQERLYFKLIQIDPDEYTWLPESLIDVCMARMGMHMRDEMMDAPFYVESTFVQPATDHTRIDSALANLLPESFGLFRFTARADVITKDTLWEIKCTSALSFDHFLQTAIYAWLWRMTRPDTPPKTVKLFNIKTGEVYRIDASTEQLTAIVAEALLDKYGTPTETPDTDFVRNCKECVNLQN